MIEKKLIVKNLAGLHLRPAGELCQKALKYESKINLQFRNKEFNAKSVLSILSACVQQDDEVVLVCSGADEKEAAEELAAFIESV
ncbi:MAG: HPr family phosphocarrier protein [Lachnospiraceae bacterium]|nr:HPr family phosphocarrier protein [Lachnospiraceae bacterium]